MKIDVLKIPEDGLTVQFTERKDWFRGLLPDSTAYDYCVEEVSCSCTLKRVQMNVLVDGRLETTVHQACSRCLEVAGMPIASRFRYTFVPADEMIIKDRELSAEDIELSCYQGDVIDLDRMLFEQILLQIPMKIICNENCKGLCPHCGANLNRSQCGCAADFVDDRLAVLRNYKI